MRIAFVISVIAFLPSLIAGVLLWLPRLVRAVIARRRRATELRPVGPPLERITADLRRLIVEHDAVRRSPTVAVRAAHLTALEGAITDRAREAARALGLELHADADRSSRTPMSRQELQRLLRRLADSGLVLPVQRLGP